MVGATEVAQHRIAVSRAAGIRRDRSPEAARGSHRAAPALSALRAMRPLLVRAQLQRGAQVAGSATRPRRPRTGTRATSTTSLYRRPGPVRSRSSPTDLAAALRISRRRCRRADRRRPRARPPACRELWNRCCAGEVRCSRARGRSPRDHRPSRRRCCSRTADRRYCRRGSGQVQATRADAGGPAVLRPDRARRRGSSPAKRGVWLRHGAPATTDVAMTLDTADALLFDQTVARSQRPHGLGDPTLDVRRARAVGSCSTCIGTVKHGISSA